MSVHTEWCCTNLIVVTPFGVGIWLRVCNLVAHVQQLAITHNYELLFSTLKHPLDSIILVFKTLNQLLNVINVKFQALHHSLNIELTAWELRKMWIKLGIWHTCVCRTT